MEARGNVRGGGGGDAARKRSRARNATTTRRARRRRGAIRAGRARRTPGLMYLPTVTEIPSLSTREDEEVLVETHRGVSGDIVRR